VINTYTYYYFLIIFFFIATLLPAPGALHSSSGVYPYPYHYPGYDSHLWQGSKCHQKSTLGTRGRVLRSHKVLPGLGGGLGEKHSPIEEDWSCNGAEMGLGRREWG